MSDHVGLDNHPGDVAAPNLFQTWAMKGLDAKMTMPTQRDQGLLDTQTGIVAPFPGEDGPASYAAAIMPHPPVQRDDGHLLRNGQRKPDDQIRCAVPEQVQWQNTNHCASDLLTLCAEIRVVHRIAKDLENAHIRINNQCGAICRRLVSEGAFWGDLEEKERKAFKKRADQMLKAIKSGDLSDGEIIGAGAVIDLLPHADALQKSCAKYKRRLGKLARQLPVWEWVEGIRGAGDVGLGQIVAEAGALHFYANPGKLWKRMGLAVINGKGQRRVSGAEALEHGFSPTRRALMYCVGDCFVKAGGPYREIYDAKKAEYLEREDIETAGHAHAMAKRYAEKRYLKDLWQAWKRCGHQHVEAQPNHATP